jgi:hypothetical protein
MFQAAARATLNNARIPIRAPARVDPKTPVVETFAEMKVCSCRGILLMESCVWMSTPYCQHAFLRRTVAGASFCLVLPWSS